MNYKKLISVIDSTDVDAQFLELYKNKNTEEAQELVKHAFEKKCPHSVVGSRIFYKGKNGEWGNQVAGYFTDSLEFASYYGHQGETIEVFLNIENPFKYDFMESGSDGDFEGTDGQCRDTYYVIRDADADAKERGLKPYDSYILYDVGEGSGPGCYIIDDYIVKDSKRVKLSDPFTFDDDGNLIPLSQRFDCNVDDIRY